MKSIEDEFSRELVIFREEAEAGAQFFYSYLAVHELAKRRRGVFRLLDENALFWNTTLGGLSPTGVCEHRPVHQGWSTLSALGGRAGQRDKGGEPSQRSDEPLFSTRDGATGSVSLVPKNDPDSGPARDPERAERQLPPDLHRRAASSGGSESVLERLLFREMGSGHFGRADRRFPRRAVARHRRQSSHGCRQDHGKIPARQLRDPGDRLDD